MAKQKLDAVIIGNGIESLLVAQELLREQKSFLIIDQSEASSESIFEDQIHNFCSDPSLAEKFGIEVTEENKDLLTYESAKWQEFIGFANHPPKFLDFIQPYLVQKKFRWKKTFSQFCQELTEALQDKIIYKAKITSFEVVEDKILSLTINDSKILQTETLVFAQSIERLVDWFEPEWLGKKNFQKLAKSTYWTRLELHLKHQEQELNLEKDHLLSGSTENAIPLFGSVYRNPEGFLCSQWISFLPAELTEDSEEAGNVLREMKRQIKRAYPSALEGLAFEKIRVAPYSDANIQVALNENQTLGNLKNLFIASGHFSAKAGMDAKLEQSSRCIEAIRTFFSLGAEKTLEP